MADSHINTRHSLDYWAAVEPDVDGMLGGFAHISRADLRGSEAFLVGLGVGSKGVGDGNGNGDGKWVQRTVDCGAGIGRITEGLLLKISHTVDIVEPMSKFSDALKGKEGIGQIFNVGLEDWSPSPSEDLRYDLIWNQWCLGHLTDAQLVTYFEKCGRALRVGGWIIVKENMSTAGEDVFDELDSSVTRTDQKFREIFEMAGLEIRKTEIQKGLPKELYPVRTYALQPGSTQ